MRPIKPELLELIQKRNASFTIVGGHSRVVLDYDDQPVELVYLEIPVSAKPSSEEIQTLMDFFSDLEENLPVKEGEFRRRFYHADPKPSHESVG